MNIETFDTWESVLIDLTGPIDEAQWESDILEPARSAIKEEMIRLPILESISPSEFKSTKMPTFLDVDYYPIRIRVNDVVIERVFPYLNSSTSDSISCELNEDYGSLDLIQISQRLRIGCDAPKFITKRHDFMNEKTFKYRFTVHMFGYDINNYDFEIVKVSDLNQFEPSNPIAA